MPDLIAPNGTPVQASDEAAPVLLANGWTRAEAQQDPEPIDLTALTVAQLRELCEERGIDAPKKATKAQLVALLEQ